MEWHGLRGWAVAAALLLGLTETAAVAFAQPMGRPAGPRSDQRLFTPEDLAAMRDMYWQRMKERLGLTDEQATDLRNTLQAQRQAMRDDVRAMGAARQQLRELMRTPTADAAAIQAAAAQVKAARERLFDQRVAAQLALRAKLTPEQFAKWLELQDRMGKAGRRHGGRFGGHRL
jgi:Spy/CpxP family protein refolding chaperone